MDDQQPTILSVEDEKNALFSLKQFLQKQGYWFFTEPISPIEAADISREVAPAIKQTNAS